MVLLVAGCLVGCCLSIIHYLAPFTKHLAVSRRRRIDASRKEVK